MAIYSFYFIFLLLVPATSAFQCNNATDCQALLNFKSAITSDPNNFLQAWNNTTPFCNWTGVTCHPSLHNRVISLELINMNFQGRISPFLSNLSLLTNLSLKGNNFSGEIPTSLGELSNLVYLSMRENKLEGSIPGSLNGCQKLKYLDLETNNLSGTIPEELGQMKTLTDLVIPHNGLTGEIPSFLSNLTELTQLILAYNYFTGKIPPELGALTKLQLMYFHVNYLEGTIPAALSNCSALITMSLIQNQLTGEIPLELGVKLQNLQEMYIQDNKLSGKIPVSLSNLSQLTLLDISLNNLVGKVPPELGKLKKLEILYLHTNYLISGSDNSSLSFLTALTNCSFLQKLNMATCEFKGSLPASIGDLSKDLHYLNLLNNYIAGEIPNSIGNLSGLASVYLSLNLLEGAIPATIGELGQLQRLVLERNRLDKPIPGHIGNMANLGLLDLRNNSITGSIPSSLGNISQLRYLYLSRNRLSGKIPTELSRCSLLMLIDLSFNNLQGSLPVEIGLFSNLALSLNFSNNNFEGEIPASIGKLGSAQAIDLSKNKLSGVIPTLIGSCISLEYLNLSNNMLEGTIPESMKEITKLIVLDFAYNQLTGNVPLWITNDLIIKSLNLSYNKLTGEVPHSGRFKNLSRSSLMGNVGLCGGSALMGLPPCAAQKPKQKTRRSHFYVIPIAVVSGFLLLVLAVVFIRRFFKNASPEPEKMTFLSHLGNRVFTQRELEIATDGFNEDNLLGRGSFGTVYKAIIDDGNTVVAVKVLHHEECSQSFKSLKRECQILAGIKHRNLVRLIGSSWASKFKAVVLEYVSNGSLEQHLYPAGGSEDEACALSLRERLSIAIDIANGLEYLHEGCSVQVAHCDLKPQNVLLDNDLVAHLADFGLGKLISDNRQPGDTSTTGFLRGSIGYIPPEYGEGNNVSARGDVYSFGIMLLEMITRKRPTSEMFSEGLDIRKWVKSAFPNHVLDVVDMTLKQESKLVGASDVLHRLKLCCTLVLDAGLMCTEENPQNRPPISLISQRLKNAWKDMGF